MKKIKDIQAEVVNGNIATMDVDAVVVPQFDSCASYGGVGGALARSGAEFGLNEYDAHSQKHPLSFGDVFMSTSGGGHCRYLLHVATVGCRKEEAFSVTRAAVYNALQLADETGLETIAIPAIGTGIIGTLTLTQSAKAVFTAVSQFAEQAKNIKKVTMVVYGSAVQADPARNVLTDNAYLNVKDEVGQKEFNMVEWLIGFAKDMCGEDY